jgi:hypothetical protein
MNKQLPTAFSQKNAKKQQSMLSFFKPGSVCNAASSVSSDVLGATSVSLSVTLSSSVSSRFTTVAPVCLPASFTGTSVSSSVNSTESSSASSSTADQPCGFYSWTTFSSSASVADDVGVIFENDRRQRERLCKLSDEDKQRLLCEHWMPPKEFEWPYYQKSTQRVYLRPNHISGPKYGCFKLSQKLCGIVCVPCALFAPDTVLNDRGKTSMLGQLVVTPLRSYRCLTGKDSSLDSHLARAYHEDSQVLATNFLMTMKDKLDIRGRIDSEAERQRKRAREKLLPIIKTVILCGRTGIALRGHRDDGPLNPERPIDTAEGKFRALLAFRVDAGDTTLRHHLQTAKKNATYISKTTQNELVEICGGMYSDLSAV